MVASEVGFQVIIGGRGGGRFTVGWIVKGQYVWQKSGS